MKRAWAWMLALSALGCAASAPPRPAASASSSIDVQYESLPKPAAPAAATFWTGRSDLIQAPPPPKPEALALPKIDRFTLPNGMQVIVVARKELPVVSFGLAVEAGGYDETRDDLGVSDFVAAMLRKGTKNETKNGTKTRSADDISRAIDFVGGSLDAQASNEGTTVACSSLSKDAPLCLDLLSDVLLHPSFPDSEMGDVRDQMLAAVASRYDSPNDLAAAHFDNQLFGDKHPNGWVLTADDVRKIDRTRLEKFWKTFYHPDHAILAVAGDVDVGRLRAQIEKTFRGWARAKVPPRPAWTIPPVAGTRILLVDRPDLTQATIMLGHAGIKHADPRWYAVTLMNYVLGGSDFSSRLMTEVRSKRGLTYGIGSSFGASLYTGAFRVSAATKNETVWDALLASVNEIRRMQADGPTGVELDKAKGYYAGSYPFSLQTAAGIAGALVEAEEHGLGAAYVRDLPLRLAAVDEAQAKAAAKDFLHPDTLLVVIVGKGDAIEPQLAKSGIQYQRINFKDPINASERAAAKPAPAKPAPAKPAPAK
ncbi:MAG TPA: pitrilysin family protein [Polyangia bacterium]|jgi:zinc protease|nr:pitrilysin family protein [Polyangia bacterium]